MELQYPEYREQEENRLQESRQIDYTDPDTIEHDIYDELLNLERWQESMSDLLANNEISQEEYEDELLKTRYYIDIKTKKYVLDDDDAKILSDLRSFKNSLSENYKNGLIDETEFNKEFIKILRKEYSILKISEDDDSGKKFDVDIDLPLDEKLRILHEEEVKYNKRVAKENGIIYPKLPRGIKKEEVDSYYDLKMSGREYQINPVIEDFLKKLSETQKLIDYHTSSYEILKIYYNSETGKNNYEFKKIAPMSKKIQEIKIDSGRANLLTPQEELYSRRLINLSNRLRQMSRDDLLKCIGVRTFKFMSYIERLRENKHFVFKFREHPENYEALEKILLDENQKYYRISSDKIFKDYTYSRPDIQVNSTSNYTQKGKVSYLAIKPGTDKRDLGDNLENFITIKPMDDPLYLELKNRRGSQTEVAEVWELRTTLPGSDKKGLVKRYLAFEDYLKDLKDILLENRSKISGKSKDILNERIRKISYYLKYSEDLEMLTNSGQIPVEKIFSERSKIFEMRRQGIYKIMNYITQYYPGAQVLAEKTESLVFDYSSVNYKDNIDKLIFIFKNYPEKLSDYVERDESIINLLSYETPLILPEDDIDLSDKEGTLRRILEWKPNTSEYDRYASELEASNFNFREFKEKHTELSSLSISEIMLQYSEKIQWNRSLEKYESLEVPEGYLDINYRLRFIMRQRNRLASRRIYRAATIKQRNEVQNELRNVFKDCRVKEPSEYAVLTENIIFSLSKLPEYYSYYTDIVKTQYKKLCDFFTKVNLKCELDSSGTVKCIIKFEPKVLTPTITEFLITEGDFEIADVNRLKKFTENLDSESVKEYIYSVREELADVYTEVLKDNVFQKAIKVIKSAARDVRIQRAAEISNNTYKPPVVSQEKPIKYRFGLEYIIDNIKIGDNYVYGGYYPMFYQYGENSEIIKENYTRADLEQLAIIFNVTIVEDSYQLYQDIMNFISEYNKKNVIIERLNFSPSEYNTYYEYLKTPVVTINYTIRPRLGVAIPGEVFTVTKDQERQYGVPFDFNENNIPIYSSELKKLADDYFIIIEGPAIFVDTSIYNRNVSDSYILVEYLDSRGKPTLFREGVAPKKIIKRTLEKLNTCARFLTKETCDDPNSFSLEINRLKMKCKWLDNKCKGIVYEDDILANFDLDKVKFKNEKKQELFETAVNISVEHIESIVKERDSSRKEIELLSKEQKLRLYNYYKLLLQTKEVTEELKEEVKDDKFYTQIEDVKLTIQPRPTYVEKMLLDTEYSRITIYQKVTKERKGPTRKIIIDKEYTIDDLVVIVKSFNEDGTVNCEVKDTGETVVLEREQFRVKTGKTMLVNEPKFCYVKKEDEKFLRDFPGYYWFLKKLNFEKTGDEVRMTTDREIKKFVPYNFIIPSKEVNGAPLITKEDIFLTMKKTAFSEFSTDDEMTYNMTIKANINEDAIDFALKNGVNVTKMMETIVGNINLAMVLEEYENMNPKQFISKTELQRIMEEAVRTKDKKTIAEYFVRAKKNKLDRELLKEAKEILKEKKEEVKVEPEPQIQDVQIEKKPVASIYAVRRRR